MARRFLSKLTRSLTAEWTPDAGVHFHGGAHGRPYPCHDPACTSPGLDVRSADRPPPAAGTSGVGGRGRGTQARRARARDPRHPRRGGPR
jgi:hypothetical protein